MKAMLGCRGIVGKPGLRHPVSKENRESYYSKINVLFTQKRQTAPNVFC